MRLLYVVNTGAAARRGLIHREGESVRSGWVLSGLMELDTFIRRPDQYVTSFSNRSDEGICAPHLPLTSGLVYQKLVT